MGFALNGCAPAEFHLKDLAKTDINQVSKIHFQQMTLLLKVMTQKLYRMNSSELDKTLGATIESQIDRIFRCPPAQPFDLLEHKKGTEAILLGFEPDFKGDRIFAMMYGLYTMLHTSYNEKCEFFMLDFLDAQRLYNSARNIEIFVWRLKARHQPNGDLFLATNICDGPVENLSFERIFGKLISLQDTLALIIATRTGRFIKEVAFLAGMTFLPVGI